MGRLVLWMKMLHNYSRDVKHRTNKLWSTVFSRPQWKQFVLHWVCRDTEWTEKRAESLLVECCAQAERVFEVWTLWTSSIRNRCQCVCVSLVLQSLCDCKEESASECVVKYCNRYLTCVCLPPVQLMRMPVERPSSSLMFFRLFSASSTVLHDRNTN